MSTINFKKVESKYFVIFNNQFEIMNHARFNNFIITAVLHNRDVTNFTVIDLSKPLSSIQGLQIAECMGRVDEFTADCYSMLKNVPQNVTAGAIDLAIRIILNKWNIL